MTDKTQSSAEKPGIIRCPDCGEVVDNFFAHVDVDCLETGAPDLSPHTSWIDEIEARANSATGGPWQSNEPLYTWIDALGCCERGAMHVFDVRGWGHLTGKGSGAHGMSEADGIAVQKANATFIAHARTDIPRLTTALRASLAREKTMREALDAISVYGGDTLHGPIAGTPDDRKWQRDGVLEMTRRARAALETQP